MKPEEWGEMNIKNAKKEKALKALSKQPSAVSIMGWGAVFEGWV